MNEKSPILSFEDLTVAYQQGDQWPEAARNVSLSIRPGETVGLVGESGSGKTTLALALMGYLPEEGMVCRGSIRFKDYELLSLKRNEMRKIWGSEISLVPQHALPSLNPSMRLGDQITEVLEYKLKLSQKEARTRALELFEQVRLGNPERVFQSYPHQLSAGMLQRVMTAMAIGVEPDLLVLDEPTSNLDVTTQSAMLDLFRELIEGQRQTAVLYITHNLGVIAQISDRVAVMYAGDLVEYGPTEDLYTQALHPYTPALLDCVPRLGDNKSDMVLRPIEGRIPSLSERPGGCVFRPRCPVSIDICAEYPPLYDAGTGRSSRCHRWEAIQKGQIDPHQPAPQEGPTEAKAAHAEPVLVLDDVQVHFSEKRSLLDMLAGESPEVVKAVDGVSLDVKRGGVLGLVGESGSGKTTLARAVVGLYERTGGVIRLRDNELPPGLKRRDRESLRGIQIVFQNPGEALNPYLSVGEALQRPLKRLRGLSDEEAESALADLLQSVNIPAEYANRLPGQLSGGEKQRIAIARAFAPYPEMLIADEPVSSLDVSVQASILNLFNQLQSQREVGTLFISHDLAVVGYLADEIAVIYLGRLMEIGPVAAIFDSPHHPYTEALLSAVPLIDPGAEQKQIRLPGEVPSPSDELSGCPFHTRCPRFLGDICIEQVPPWREQESQQKRIFCHIPLDELVEAQGDTFRFSKGDQPTREP